MKRLFILINTMVLVALQTASGRNTPKLELTAEDALRLQIFLDQSHFGPGVIDGKPGRFTIHALESWNEVNGHAPENFDAIIKQARLEVKHPIATAVVPEIATEWIDPTLPYDSNRAGQAQRKRMSYRRMSEFLAERYHCDEDFLRAMNATTKMDKLKPGDSILVPNIEPFLIEKLGGNTHQKDDKLSQRHVVVDTRNNQLRIYEPVRTALVVAKPGESIPLSHGRKNTGLVASFPITPGRSQFIAFGTWELRNMVEMPWWRYDQTFLDTGERGPEEQWLNIPPGPNSPVGIIWNGTSKPGIGLHGTSSPDSIGRARSAGCIRLCNWDAARLPKFIRPGATVEIR